MPDWRHDVRARLSSLRLSATREAEIVDELSQHLDDRYRELVGGGVSEDEAARLALAGFRNDSLLARHLAALRQAQTPPSVTPGSPPRRLLGDLWQDLRYAARTLRKQPGFAIAVVLTLALGIGANTAIFTLINAVMFRSLPVPAPEQLVAVGDPSRPTALWEGGPMVDVLSYPMYQRLRDRNKVFSGLLASGKTGRLEMIADDGAPELVRGRLVSSNYFDVLQIRPPLGRGFTSGEDQANASAVAVISQEFWKTRFGGHPTILGRVIRLNRSPVTIVGVAAPGFSGEVIGSPADLWIPLTMQAQVQGQRRLERADANWLLGLGRLAPGVSLSQARAELVVLAQQALVELTGAGASEETLREIRGQVLPVEPGGQGFSWVRRNLASVLFTLMAVVGLVLLIACGNVANLLLARATSRQKEMSVRLALGASRSRLVRQLLTEGAILAGLGGLTGLLIAGWGSRLLSGLVARGGPNPVPFDVDVRPDLAVLTFATAASALTAMLFGVVPAFRATRVELAPVLKDSARGVTQGRWSLARVLVVGQIALSIPLLLVAGLFVRSLIDLERLDVGYQRDAIVLLKADLTIGQNLSIAEQLSRARGLVERLQSLPGIHGVTMSENGLFSGTDSRTEGLQVEGFDSLRPEDRTASFDHVGPGYFRILGTPLLAGREFDERDTVAAPLVAIVNETMAGTYFGTSSPLGKSLQNGGDRYTIVGVVKDSRQQALKGKPERRFYLPLLQSMDPVAAWNFAIRTTVDAASVIPQVRREVQTFDPNLRVSTLEPVRTLMAQAIGNERTVAQLSGVFGAVAVLLAVAGLYGVMSYTMARRTSEIGLRMALGAPRASVIRMVLRETLVLIAAGLVLGVPAALMSSRLTAASFSDLTPHDPPMIAAALLVMLVAGLCAGLVPAIRASRIDAIKALRQE
jgi:predicted permease